MARISEAYERAMDAVIALNNEPLIKTIGSLFVKAIPGTADDRLFDAVFAVAGYLEANRSQIDPVVEWLDATLAGVFGAGSDALPAEIAADLQTLAEFGCPSDPDCDETECDDETEG